MGNWNKTLHGAMWNNEWVDDDVVIPNAPEKSVTWDDLTPEMQQIISNVRKQEAEKEKQKYHKNNGYKEVIGKDGRKHVIKTEAPLESASNRKINK